VLNGGVTLVPPSEYDGSIRAAAVMRPVTTITVATCFCIITLITLYVKPLHTVATVIITSVFNQPDFHGYHRLLWVHQVLQYSSDCIVLENGAGAVFCEVGGVA